MKKPKYLTARVFRCLKNQKKHAFFMAQKPLETTQTLAYLWNNGESLGRTEKN
jgi:hypothetical protein